MNIRSGTTMTLLKANTDLRCFNHDPDSSRSQGFCDCYSNLFRKALLNCGCDKELSLSVSHKQLNISAVSRICKNLKMQTSERWKAETQQLLPVGFVCCLGHRRPRPIPGPQYRCWRELRKPGALQHPWRGWIRAATVSRVCSKTNRILITSTSTEESRANEKIARQKD